METACICPVKQDHKDTITLRATLDFRGAMACKHAVSVLRTVDPDASDGDILAVLTEHYVIHGIESWSAREKVDGQWQPVSLTPPNIRRLVLADNAIAFQVADEADEAYTALILLPLLGVAATSSPPTPTEDESTSPPTGRKATRPTPLKRSSTFTSPTDDIGTTMGSHDGDSSFSPSSTSAA